MFKGTVATHPDNFSTDSLEGDVPSKNDEDIIFSIPDSKRLTVTIAGYSGVATRKAGLPGMDRVLRPSDRRLLSSEERRFHQIMARFMEGRRVHIMGRVILSTVRSSAASRPRETDHLRCLYIARDRNTIEASPEINFNAKSCKYHS